MTPATPAQQDYIDTLLRDRVVPESWAARISTLQAAGISKSEASNAITSLKALPFKPNGRAAARGAVPAVAQGYYALGTKDRPRRYRVKAPTKGRWAGRTFVELIEAHDVRTAVRGLQAQEILRAIAVDPAAAGKLYADVTGRCWVCHLLLTDDASVATGIGPDCFEKRNGRRRTAADLPST